MTGIVAHTYPEWRLKLAGQVAHWSTDYSLASRNRDSGAAETYIPYTETAFDWLNYQS